MISPEQLIYSFIFIQGAIVDSQFQQFISISHNNYYFIVVQKLNLSHPCKLMLATAIYVIMFSCFAMFVFDIGNLFDECQQLQKILIKVVYRHIPTQSYAELFIVKILLLLIIARAVIKNINLRNYNSSQYGMYEIIITCSQFNQSIDAIRTNWV